MKKLTQIITVILILQVLVSCRKQEVSIYPSNDPNSIMVDKNGGILNFGTLSTLDELIIPAGTFNEDTHVGYVLDREWRNYFEDPFYSAINGYTCDGIYFYPFDLEVNKTCTLKYSKDAQNPNINLSNVHIYKIANYLTPDFVHIDENGYRVYPDYEDYEEITNYTTYLETINGFNYRVFEIPVESFEYFYSINVAIN